MPSPLNSLRPKERSYSRPVDVRQWLSGDAVLDATIYVSDTLKSRNYRLRVAFWTRAPGSQSLAIEGRQSDGWY